MGFAISSNDLSGVNLEENSWIIDTWKLPCNGYDCLVYHEFQDQSCSWWVWEIFKIAIVDIMFKNPQFDMKAFM